MPENNNLNVDDYGQTLVSDMDNYALAVGTQFEQAPADGAARYPLDRQLSREEGLEDLQIRFPYLPISPFGNSISSIVLTANTAKEIRIPSGSKMCKISKLENVEAYFTLSGIPQIPTSDIVGGGSAFINSNEWIACIGNGSIGLISKTDTIVTVRFFSQL